MDQRTLSGSSYGTSLTAYATAAIMLHDQKSKIQEVFCAGLTVECLVCNEGAEDLCFKTAGFEQTTRAL